MEEKQTTINRLYALRAGMSLLAMQYDKYYSAMYDIQKLYLEMSETYKNILEGKLHKSQYKYFDHIVDFPRLGTDERSSACKNNSLSCYGHYISFRPSFNDPTYSFKEYWAENSEYWLNVLGQVCFFNLAEYRQDLTSVLKHYESFSDLIKQYQSDMMRRDALFCGMTSTNGKSRLTKSPINCVLQEIFLWKRPHAIWKDKTKNSETIWSVGHLRHKIG